jgi:hypothetical protein
MASEISRKRLCGMGPGRVAANHAIVYVWRASSASRRSSLRPALSRSGGAWLPSPEAHATWPRMRSRRARWNSLSAPVSAVAKSPSAASNSAWRLASAAASARSARLAGSAVSATARCRNAAAAATPPRACALPAESSSSAAISSPGPGIARARCHARRSGSISGSVASARARWTRWRSSAAAER